MRGKDRSVDGSAEPNRPTFLQSDEGISPFRVFWGEGGAGDRDEPSARGEAREGGGEMTPGGVGHAAFDMDTSRERRVHQYDARADRAIEMIVDMRGIVLRDHRTGKDLFQEGMARRRIFVEHKSGTGEFGKDRHEAGAGRRLQHNIIRHDAGGAGRDIGERRRR